MGKCSWQRGLPDEARSSIASNTCPASVYYLPFSTQTFLYNYGYNNLCQDIRQRRGRQLNWSMVKSVRLLPYLMSGLKPSSSGIIARKTGDVRLRDSPGKPNHEWKGRMVELNITSLSYLQVTSISGRICTGWTKLIHWIASIYAINSRCAWCSRRHGTHFFTPFTFWKALL